MKLAKSRLTAQGQVSVPARVRKHLGLVPGSVLEWDAEQETVVVRRVGSHSFADVHDALFSEQPERKTLQELKEGIRKHIRALHARG
jgi:antitoxin PrlF